MLQERKKAPTLQKKSFRETGESQSEDDETASNSNVRGRAFYHGMLSQSKQKKMCAYENHIVFKEVTQGQVFGVRTLLDNITINKQIQTNSIRLSERLGLNYEEYFDRFKDKKRRQEQDQFRIAPDQSCFDFANELTLKSEEDYSMPG